MEIFQEIINYIALLIWLWLQFFLLAIELRFVVQWFLNFNPYTEPFLRLWNFTDPIFLFGRNLYPKFFGMDLTPMINMRLLVNFIGVVEPSALDAFN
jgi:uncharacterized protein YggT (Ycf19 family)